MPLSKLSWDLQTFPKSSSDCLWLGKVSRTLGELLTHPTVSIHAKICLWCPSSLNSYTFEISELYHRSLYLSCKSDSELMASGGKGKASYVQFQFWNGINCIFEREDLHLIKIFTFFFRIQMITTGCGHGRWCGKISGVKSRGCSQLGICTGNPLFWNTSSKYKN